MIKPLFRFYDPTEGRILVDGVDLKNIPIDVWYMHMGVLFQDYARYFLTLRENIAFGNIAKKTNGNIKMALDKVEGSEILNNLPNGYEQTLGRWFEGGIELSGGQWQKIAIARAIYRQSPILIMDEPTSNIDADAEYEIFNNLKKLYENKNLIFISHRFSSVRTSDTIFVLEKGRLVEQGKHDDLVYRDGLYAKFFHLQKQGYVLFISTLMYLTLHQFKRKDVHLHHLG